VQRLQPSVAQYIDATLLHIAKNPAFNKIIFLVFLNQKY